MHDDVTGGVRGEQNGSLQVVLPYTNCRHTSSPRGCQFFECDSVSLMTMKRAVQNVTSSFVAIVTCSASVVKLNTTSTLIGSPDHTNGACAR